MKSLVIIFSLVDLSLSSTCTDTKPEVNEDCLSVYMENNMCCYHEVTFGSKETKECVEKPVTDSGIKKCALGMTMLLIIFLSYSTANLIRIFSIDKALINHWVFLTIVIGDVFVHPIVVLLFIINKEKLNQIKTLCHKNKEYISIETVTNSDDSLID